jgi:hypothetical protein
MKVIVSPRANTFFTSLSSDTFKNSIVLIVEKTGKLNYSFDIFKEAYNTKVAHLDELYMHNAIKIDLENIEPLWFKRYIYGDPSLITQVLENIEFDELYLPSGLFDPIAIVSTWEVLNSYGSLLQNKRVCIYVERPFLDFFLLRWEGIEYTKYVFVYKAWEALYNKFENINYFDWGGGLSLQYHLFRFGNKLPSSELIKAWSGFDNILVDNLIEKELVLCVEKLLQGEDTE